MTRVTIRPACYRGRPGYTIVESGGHGWHKRVFAESMRAAEHIKQKMKRNERINLADFAVGREASA